MERLITQGVVRIIESDVVVRVVFTFDHGKGQIGVESARGEKDALEMFFSPVVASRLSHFFIARLHDEKCPSVDGGECTCMMKNPLLTENTKEKIQELDALLRKTSSAEGLSSPVVTRDSTTGR